MSVDMPVKTFVARFEAGDFNSNDVHTQIEAGWYDWFCRDTSLCNKTKVLARKVKQLMKSPKVDVEKHYVFFKNNCPMLGGLYDDFRFCDLETRNVLYTVVPSSPRGAEVWGTENDFKEPLVTGTWKDVKNFFLKTAEE